MIKGRVSGFSTEDLNAPVLGHRSMPRLERIGGPAGQQSRLGTARKCCWVGSAEFEASTCPGAPGKTGSPVEIIQSKRRSIRSLRRSEERQP
jgi:hypothetical protein